MSGRNRAGGGTDDPPLGAVVVDDDAAVASLHELFVRSHPSFVVAATAYDGPSAIEVILRTRPDVVLLDFHLPHRSGLEVLRAIRASDIRQPEFIAVTAARDIESVRAARAAGVRHYLVKPFSAGALRDRLDDVVRDRRRFEKESSESALDQRDIDELFASSVHPVPLPKGLSLETLLAVERVMAGEESLTSSAVGDLVGISRVSARRYLEYLVQVQRADRSLDYATAGRPSSRYSRRSAE